MPDVTKDTASRRNYELLGNVELPDHSKAGYPTRDFEWRSHQFQQTLAQLTDKALFGRADEDFLKVLDVGCGNGALTIFAVGPGREIYGIDISEGLVKEAQQRSPAIRGCVASCYDLPFPDASFDIVFSLGLLQTISNGARYIQELVRVLKPNGTGLIEFLPKWNLLDVLPRAAMHAIRLDWAGARGSFRALWSTARSWHGDFPVHRTSALHVKKCLLRAGATRARIISKRWFFFNTHYTTILFSR